MKPCHANEIDEARHVVANLADATGIGLLGVGAVVKLCECSFLNASSFAVRSAGEMLVMGLAFMQPPAVRGRGCQSGHNASSSTYARKATP